MLLRPNTCCIMCYRYLMSLVSKVVEICLWEKGKNVCIWEVVEICLMGEGEKRVCLGSYRNLLERKREKRE